MKAKPILKIIIALAVGAFLVVAYVYGIDIYSQSRQHYPVWGGEGLTMEHFLELQ